MANNQSWIQDIVASMNNILNMDVLDALQRGERMTHLVREAVSDIEVVTEIRMEYPLVLEGICLLDTEAMKDVSEEGLASLVTGIIIATWMRDEGEVADEDQYFEGVMGANDDEEEVENAEAAVEMELDDDTNSESAK